MSAEFERIEQILIQLPEQSRRELVLFAETLLNRKGKSVDSRRSRIPSSFGSWDSGDPNSADNDKIDADLAE